MKFLVRNYRPISIALSLFILAMAFVVGSSKEWWNFCVPFTFFLGFLLYGFGTLRAWKCGRRLVLVIDLLLLVCLWCAFLLSILKVGGLI